LACICSQVSLIVSHISDVIDPRTERAFSRVNSMQLAIDDGSCVSQARNRATVSGVAGLPVARNASMFSVITSGSAADASSPAFADSSASDCPTSRMRAMFSARSR
jgi:hypothetical protein